MRWPAWLCRRKPRASIEATNAQERARGDLDEVRARQPRVDATTRFLAAERRSNHFATAMEKLFRGA